MNPTGDHEEYRLRVGVFAQAVAELRIWTAPAGDERVIALACGSTRYLAVKSRLPVFCL